MRIKMRYALCMDIRALLISNQNSLHQGSQDSGRHENPTVIII